MSETMMNPEVKQQWVAALRSGKYKQGAGKLRSIDDEFCCMGVLCDLAATAGVVEVEPPRRHRPAGYLYGGSRGKRAGILPPEVQEWSGLSSGNPTVALSDVDVDSPGEDNYGLAHVNDYLDYPFPQIADLIEEQL